MAIFETIGIAATLEQCAEECAELAQASLKMARIIRGENPTPADREYVLAHLAEEMADVLVCMDEITESGLISNESVESYMAWKRERWEGRVNEKKEMARIKNT